MIVYGPVPSRRLGRSIGINNIPIKNCTYSCIYCQVGKTSNKLPYRREFYSTDKIVKEVENKLNEMVLKNEKADYLSFVPDGEPTLDINIGKTINSLKSFGIKIAVITNSSLIWDSEVRNDILNADWVSVKIDSVFWDRWKKINQPEKTLELTKILKGIEDFNSLFKGELVTETMLVDKINDDEHSLIETAKFIKSINPYSAYILVPIRPPFTKIQMPNNFSIERAAEIYRRFISNVKLINFNEGSNFSSFTNPVDELLSILSVHPMRKDAIMEYINNANLSQEEFAELLINKKIKEVEYNNLSFYQLFNEV
ncbi:MAG TPA: radical SAM protein [Melioribacteraceae bacterium]|nr:radical SAM protein [Melioribacteraceae bacterium]